MEIAAHYPEVNKDIVLASAAMHDLGLAGPRETHHLLSGEIVRHDAFLSAHFTSEEVELIAQAVEDHRASSKHSPRSIYGCILAEADRLIDSDTVIRRCLQYGIDHYPQLDKEGHYKRACGHLREKYGEDGYMKLFIPESPNAEPLARLRALLKDETALRRKFEEVYRTLQKA